MRPRLGPTLGMAVLVAACGCDRTDTDTATLPLALLDACEPPGPVDRIEVRALGDFPPTEQTVEILRPEPPDDRVEQLPGETRLLGVDALSGSEWRAGGIRVVRGGDFTRSVLLLPLGRSCALGDPEVRLPPGAVAAPLADGGLLLAGGSTDGIATRRLVVLEGGATLSELPGSGLQNRREGASATRVDDAVVVVGGALGGSGVAHDTWERIDVDGGTVTLGEPSLAQPRRDHGASRLPDGRVLVVGGRREADGAPLPSAEWIDPAAGRAGVLDGGLDEGLVAPEVLALDDGTVVVAGGRTADAALSRRLYVLDGDSLQAGPRLPAFTGGQAVALPGGRMAWIGPAGEGAARHTALAVVRRRPPYDEAAPTLAVHSVELPASVPLLDPVRAAALPDGTILLVGADPEARPRAFVVDPGLGLARETHASRVPERLVALTDGSVAEIDRTGASLRRESMRTAFDSPPATLLAGGPPDPPRLRRLGQQVAFDAPERWQARRDGLLALEPDARVDVPTLRFARFEVTTLAVAAPEGAELRAALLLVRPGAPPLAVQVRSGRVAVGDCAVERSPGAPLSLTRDGEELRLAAGAGERRCEVDGLPERVGLAVRLGEGTLVSALRVRRLP